MAQPLPVASRHPCISKRARGDSLFSVVKHNNFANRLLSPLSFLFQGRWSRKSGTESLPAFMEMLFILYVSLFIFQPCLISGDHWEMQTPSAECLEVRLPAAARDIGITLDGAGVAWERVTGPLSHSSWVTRGTVTALSGPSSPAA